MPRGGSHIGYSLFLIEVLGRFFLVTGEACFNEVFLIAFTPVKLPPKL